MQRTKFLRGSSLGFYALGSLLVVFNAGPMAGVLFFVGTVLAIAALVHKEN